MKHAQRYRREILDKGNETVLIIRNIQAEDMGTYTVRAENDVEARNLTFTINVKGIPG